MPTIPAGLPTPICPKCNERTCKLSSTNASGARKFKAMCKTCIVAARPEGWVNPEGDRRGKRPSKKKKKRNIISDLRLDDLGYRSKSVFRMTREL